ncbi:helix-turn-helix transcriptional regulator [Streptococcus dentiloxodontae]
MELGNHLQQARLAAHLTQEDVAQKLFVTRQTISRWEQNKTLPNIYVLQDLSQLYQVDLQYFLGKTEQIEEPVPKKRLHLLSLAGVILFNIIFFLTAYMMLVAFLLCFWGFAVGFILMPLTHFTNSNFIYIVIDNHRFVPSLGWSFTLCGIGLLMLPLMWWLTRQVWRFTKHYVRYNIKSVYY